MSRPNHDADLVTTLRAQARDDEYPSVQETQIQVADEIERLGAEVERLRAPFTTVDIGPRLRVIFRQVDGPREWLDGNHVQVELHDVEAGALGSLPYPVAIAWVTLHHPDVLPPTLDFILVPDHIRRNGYATRLVEACSERWPDLLLTDAISDTGEAFSESLEAGD